MPARLRRKPRCLPCPRVAARLNCIHHLLSQIPYGEVAHQPIILPERVRNPDYLRGPIPAAMYVPAVY